MEETLRLCGEAADWWVAKISEEHKAIPSCKLDGVRRDLKKAIKNHVSFGSRLRLSTCGRRDPIIDNILFNNGLFPSFLPLGYEMIIIMNHVYVYDNDGNILIF